MKYSNIVTYFTTPLLIYGCFLRHVQAQESVLCSMYNSSVEVITAHEYSKIYHSIEIYSPKSVTSSYHCFSSDRKVSEIMNITKTSIQSFNNHIDKISFIITMKRLGGAIIRCFCENKVENVTFEAMKLIVERKVTIPEIIFRAMVLIFVVVITFSMGCSIEMDIVWGYMKKPIAPIIGLLSQYLIMPLLAFGISKVANLNNEFAFGLLTVGCSPGGTGSNIWTVLLKGDLNLSMTMTFVSTIMALAMMPFWMFCFGRFFLDYKSISIPYLFIILNLIQVIVPAISGVLFRRKWKSKALKIIKFTKYLALGFIIFLMTFGIYANFYMYILIFDHPHVIPIAAMLPWLGFLFGFATGMITRQGITRSLTISLEVGIQNIGIAILILKFSMPKPLGDIAAIVPIVVALVTPFPLMFGYICELIITKCKKSPKEDRKMEHSLSDLSVQPTYTFVKKKEVPKQSVIEPTLYYCEELSSYFEESSPSLG